MYNEYKKIKLQGNYKEITRKLRKILINICKEYILNFYSY